MFDCNDFRIKDLDELVSLTKKQKNGFDVRENNYFVLGKNCRMYTNKNRRTGEIKLRIRNDVLNELKGFDADGQLPIDCLDFNGLAENIVMFDYLISGGSMLPKINVDVMKTHLLLTNVDALLNGQPAPMKVTKIMTDEEYAKAIAKAKKAFNKEQQSIIESQTPQYDG